MPEYKISLSGTFSGKTRMDAIREFWDFVDDAETHDLKREEEK